MVEKDKLDTHKATNSTSMLMKDDE